MPESIKAPDAFRTISEVAEDLDLPQHVLRFWETRFAQIKPMKRGGGRRYYRPEDIDLLRGIRVLLYAEGFTIRGVQRVLKDKGVSFVAGVGQAGSVDADQVAHRDDAEADEPDAAGDAASAAESKPRRVEPADMQSDDLLDSRTDPGFAPDPAPDAAEDATGRVRGARRPQEPRNGDEALSAAIPVRQRQPSRQAIPAQLTGDDRRRVEAALAELLEVRELLDQV